MGWRRGGLSRCCCLGTFTLEDAERCSPGRLFTHRNPSSGVGVRAGRSSTTGTCLDRCFYARTASQLPCPRPESASRPRSPETRPRQPGASRSSRWGLAAAQTEPRCAGGTGAGPGAASQRGASATGCVVTEDSDGSKDSGAMSEGAGDGGPKMRYPKSQ